MICVIKSSDIMKLLKDKNADLSKEELEKIIEEELKKDENEMDTDLIEMCLDALKETENAPKKKNLSFIRIASYVSVAAVLVFVISAVIPKLTERNSTKKVIEETTTYSAVATTSPVTEEATTKASTVTTRAQTNPAPIIKEETTKAPSTEKGMSTVAPEANSESVLKKLLSANGFDNIVLPKIIFESAEIIGKNFEENKAEIKIKSNEKNYEITIEKSSEKIEDENTIGVNGLKVSVQSENNLAEIKYSKNNLNYKIVFESSYEEAVKIAKTIC